MLLACPHIVADKTLFMQLFQQLQPSPHTRVVQLAADSGLTALYRIVNVCSFFYELFLDVRYLLQQM